MVRGNQKLRDAMKHKLNPHLGAIRKITSAEYKLESEDTEIKKLRIWIEKYIAPHGHHTHLVEASLCAVTNRDEPLHSIFAINRSEMHYNLNTEIRDSEKDRVRRGNAYESAGVHGSRIDRATGNTERKQRKERNRVRESRQNPYVIQATRDLHNSVAHVNDDVRKKLKGQLVNQKKQLKAER